MSNKTRGIVKEREARIELLNNGFPHVLRSRGSLGVVDLIAINKEEVKFVSVKRVKGKYCSFKEELESLRNFEVPSYAKKELWIYKDRLKGIRNKSEIEKKIV